MRNVQLIWIRIAQKAVFRYGELYERLRSTLRTDHSQQLPISTISKLVIVSALYIIDVAAHQTHVLFVSLELARNPPDGVSVGLGDDENIFCWELMIIGPPDTLYEGGFFAAKLVFPSDFPNQPPVMTFITPLWHPNGNMMHAAI